MPKHPVTLAVRALRAANVAFEPHVYPFHPPELARVLDVTAVDVAVAS